MDIALNTIAAAPSARPAAAGGLLQAVLRSLRYRIHYRSVIRELERFDAHMLKDIGIPPWELETFAQALASDQAAGRSGMRETLAALAEPVSRLLGPRTGAVPGLWR